jgi:hypothetical protein
MPGPWSVNTVRVVASAAAQYATGPVRAALHASVMMSSLTAAAQLRACLTVQDPFSTIQGLTEAVECAAVDADVPLAPGAALLPDAFRVSPRGGPVEAVVVALWPPLLNLVLLLATTGATRVVCCLVPVAYICDTHVARSRWLGQLRAAGRLVFVPSAGLDPTPGQEWARSANGVVPRQGRDSCRAPNVSPAQKRRLTLPGAGGAPCVCPRMPQAPVPSTSGESTARPGSSGVW